jgi:hypothetical protein
MDKPASNTTADPLAVLRERLDEALALLDVTVQSPPWATQSARRRLNQLSYALTTARGGLVKARDLLGR